MNIKLISPRMSLRPMDTELKRRMSPSLSLATLAACTPSEYNVYIEDENIAILNLNDKPDLVGITVNIDTSNRAYEISKHYLKRNIPVILGGIHVSANPHEAIQYCHSVCIGDGIDIWKNILKDFKSGKPARFYQSVNITTYNPPIPAWDKIPVNEYLYSNIISTSSGCPYTCRFCYNSSAYRKNRYFNRDINTVLREIESHNTKHIMFIDDNFIGNPKWTETFLKRIIPYKLKWNAAVTVNIGKRPELLDLMQTSGCQSLFIGFESLNALSLKHMKKNQNKIEYYNSTISEIHKRDIMINASIVFGFDNDDPTVFKRTADWLIYNKIASMTAHILTPYPGTSLYNEMLQSNRILHKDYTHYNTANVVYKPLNMTKEELQAGYEWSYKYFYSTKNILKRMPFNSRQLKPFLLFNFGYRKFGKMVSRITGIRRMQKLGSLGRKLSYNIK